MKVKLVLFLGFIVVFNSCEGLKCPGKCTKNTKLCKEKGGKIVGYCTKELACCDLSAKTIGSCGDTKTGLPLAIFQSPEYPDLSSGDSICQFIFEIGPNTQGLSVEFLDARMEGYGFTPHSPCETDMIFLKGFPNWQPPARCGNLTGYAAIIDQHDLKHMKSLTILAVMSSKRYRWKIRISQLTHAKTVHDKDHQTGDITSNSEEAAFEDDESVVEDETGDLSDLLSDRSGLRRRRIIGRNQPSWISEPAETEDDEDLEFGEPLVVHGEDTMIWEVPWQASLRVQYSPAFLKAYNLSDEVNKESSNCSSSDGNHFCGGSIISNRHILSATHCFCGSSKMRDWQKVGNVKVILGDTDLCADDKVKYGHASQIFTIDKVMYHHAYDDSTIINDVVVIKLKERIKFNDYIKPIALSKRNMTYEGRPVKVSGWGLTNLTIPSPSLPFILQSTDEMFVQNQSYCDDISVTMYGATKNLIRMYPKYTDAFRSILCTTFSANTSFKLVGPGDSGGPLVIKKNGDTPPIQIGIVSFGIPALPAVGEHDNKFVDFFQDVSYYRNWIDLAMLA